MRKIISLILLIFLLSGCVPIKESETKKAPDSKISGAWITYSEINSMLGGDFKAEFQKCIITLKANSITDIFVHIRPFCDSLYKSAFFPQNSLAQNLDYDAFSYIIENAHKENIKVHAWVNPYRVKTADESIDTLPEESPIKNLEQNVDYTVYNGVYLLPSSEKAKRLITDGIREICSSYDVDGIHFDDYFYPTSDQNFDLSAYENYKSATDNPMSLKEFRTNNINSLISSVYTAIKFIDKDILFSVSPSAIITKNKNDCFADIKAWCKNGCVDIIMPQLYFGFLYPEKEYRFDNLINSWKDYIGKTNVKIVVGLALYKIDTENPPDSEEWKNGKSIIEKQIKICNEDERISGYCLFSYSYFNKIA